MKKTISLLVILFAFALSFLHAQQYSQESLQNKVDKFTKMKKTGTVMLASGAASSILGIVLLATADWEESSDEYGNTNYNSTDGGAIVGVLMTGLGVGLIGGGIPLTIIGNKKSQQYKNRLDELTLVPYYHSKNAGICLTFRF